MFPQRFRESKVTSLERIFLLAHRRLVADGIFAFSVEKPKGFCNDYRLEARLGSTLGHLRDVSSLKILASLLLVVRPGAPSSFLFLVYSVV